MSYSILDSIGNTPLVEIRHLNPNPKVRILAKLESMNPGGSIKDRAALYMIREGERSGELTPGKTVIEATSGNTGIGLSLICAARGYRLILAMSEAASVERQKILRARGAEIILTPGHLGTDGAIEEIYRMAREYPETYFMTDQYNNDANWRAHYETTAEEIISQTGGEISALVATLGTSGTLMGLSRRLKEYDPNIRIVGGEPYLGHKIQGLKNMKEAYQPELFNKKLLDAKINVEDEAAFEMTRQLAVKEGLFVGMSSGAAMALAAEEARKMDGGTLVVIFPDGGERYLSTSLFACRSKMELKLFDSWSRKKKNLATRAQGKVSIYSCGPTAHGRIGLNVSRRVVFADLLCRYLESRGQSVSHIMGITDLDDNVIQGARQKGMKVSEFAAGHIEQFRRDLGFLRVKPALKYPMVSEHLDDMVEMAGRLMEKGAAYEKLKSVYFDISKLPDYGTLSGINPEKIRPGLTVDLDDYEKDNPRDFTLFKRSKLSEIKNGECVATPWGSARPSLHLQCAAMSAKYFKDGFDIHTGSRELIFPHHENELAIAKALTGTSPAGSWIHCERAFLTGDDARDDLGSLVDMGYSGREIRFFLLFRHYRKQLAVSREGIEESVKSLAKMDACIKALKRISGGEVSPETDQIVYDIKSGFVSAMDDDLNVSSVLASLFRAVKRLNSMMGEGALGGECAGKILDAFAWVDEVLQIFDLQDVVEDKELLRLEELRRKARLEKDWPLADSLRDEMVALGHEPRDGKTL